MSDDAAILICVTMEEMVVPREEFPEGSQVGWCHICACEVFISPSGIEFLDTGALPTCMECVAGMDAGPLDYAPGAIEGMRERGASIDEIREAFQYAQAELARRRARRGREAVGPDHPGSGGPG